MPVLVQFIQTGGWDIWTINFADIANITGMKKVINASAKTEIH